MHILRPCIKAGAGLGHGGGHVTVAADEGLGKELAEFVQDGEQLGALLWRARVGRMAKGIQSALIADADAATVVRAAVCTHFKELAVLGNGAVAADVKMVADGAESTCPVVA